MGRLDQDPIPITFNWPVKYKLKNNIDHSRRNIELKIQFNGNKAVELFDTNGDIYSIEFIKVHTVVGSGSYGGNYTECFSYKAIGYKGEIDLFSVIPLKGDMFSNNINIQILPPGPIKNEYTATTPEPLTMFQHFSFNLLSRRIFNILKPSF